MSSSSPPTRKCQRVSLEEIEDATENFGETYVVGQGGEGKVYRAEIMLGRNESTQVAVKHLKPNSSGFEDEIQIMPKIQHPNIVTLLGYCNDSGQKILIYEYMANGSLADYVQKNHRKPPTSTTSLPWQRRLKICLGAALGLKHLHAETKEFAMGIIHRDVKPNNILLDANWVAKISDFGMFKLSRADQIDSAMPTMLKGTGGYYAPEYLKYQHVTRKIDVYAFGVVLFQVLCRKMPWDRGDESYYGMEDEDLGQWARQNVDSMIQGEISDYCLNAFTEIIRKSLSVNPKKRPTMDEVVSNLRNALERQERKDEAKILEAAREAEHQGREDEAKILEAAREAEGSSEFSDGKREMTMKEFKKWLMKFDADKDGRLSRDELRQAVRASGARFSSVKVRSMLKTADANGDGFIDENEIEKLVAFAEKEMNVKIVAY